MINEIYLKTRLYCIKRINQLYKRVKKDKFLINEVKNILFIHTLMIGDSILALPALAILKKRFPTARISILTTEKGKEIFSTLNFVDNFFFYNSYKKVSIINFFKLIKYLRSQKFELIIDTQDTLIDLKRSLLPWLANSSYRVYYQRGGFEGLFPTYQVKYIKDNMINLHTSLVNFSRKKIFNNPKLHFNINKRYKNSLKKKLFRNNIKDSSKIIVIHPCARNHSKLWSQKKFSLVANYFRKNEYIVILTGDEYDYYYNEEIKRLCQNKIINLSGEISFLELGALLSYSKLLISIDTSVVHLASALKTPTVALFGPTILDFWKPNNNFQIILKKTSLCSQDCCQIDLNKIIPNTNNCVRNYKCLQNITVDEVINESKKLLKNGRY